MNYSREDYLAKLNIEGKHNVWAAHYPKIYCRIDKVILSTNAKVCDMGVGAGQLLDGLYNLNMVCVEADISKYLIKHYTDSVSKENKKIPFKS